MQRRKAARNLTAALFLVAWTNCSATNGYFANAFGLKSAGMGGSAAAVAQEPLGGATNPAAMVFLEENVWQVSGSWFSPRASAVRVGSGPAGLDGAAASEKTNFFIPEFGVNWLIKAHRDDTNVKSRRGDIAIGLSVYGNAITTKYPSGQISSTSGCTAFNPNTTSYNLLCGNGKLGVDTPQYLASPYAAWRFAEDHSIGAAPIIAFQRFASYGLQSLASPALSNNVASVTNRGHDRSWGVGVRVGYMGHIIRDKLTVGVAYASRVRLKRFDDYAGLLAESGKFDIPESFLVGFAFAPGKDWLVAVDYQRINYGQVNTIGNASHLLVTCAPGQRDNCLGGANGTGVGWRDIDVWKIGIQRKLDEAWTVRAGYSHTDNPITPADVTLNILAPGVVKDHYTAGLTYRFKDASEVTAAFAYSKKNSITGQSLFASFGAPPTTIETISMKQYFFGLAYSRNY